MTTDDLADAAQVAELHRQNQEWLDRARGRDAARYASDAEADFMRMVDQRRAQAQSLAGTVDFDRDRMSRAVAAMVDEETGTTKDPGTWWRQPQPRPTYTRTLRDQRRPAESVPNGSGSSPSLGHAEALNDAHRASGGVTAGETADPLAHVEDVVPLLAIHEQRRLVAAELARSRSVDAALHQSPTTTPEFGDGRPRGDVPGLRPNPGMLRALLQPVLFLKLEEPVGAFEKGDVLAAQFWGEGRVMLTPLPAAAAKGRIPTTFPANKIHAVIAGPVAPHYEEPKRGWVGTGEFDELHPAPGTDAYDALHPLG